MEVTTLAQAKQRITEQAEYIRYLESRLGVQISFPKNWTSTRRQEKILGLLSMGGLITYERLIETIYHDESDGGAMSAKRCLTVSMFYLRQRLQKQGIEISGRFGFGYEVEGESLRRLRNAARLKIR